tara:strand:- start:46472 stop:47449 length:978 start_codon:yes stop_codon:yes gene_type:complete
MKLLFFLVIALFSYHSFADCLVSAKMDSIYKVECLGYLGQTTLYDEGSNEFIVLKSSDQVLTVDGGEADLEVGTRFYLNPPVRKQPKPIIVEVDVPAAKAIFDPLKANNYRLFAKALSYQNMNTSADFQLSTTKIETSNNEIKTLPLSFSLEMNFDNYGIILSPDFEDEAGEVVLYRDFGGFSMGLHTKVVLEKENTEVISGGTKLQDDDVSSSTIQAGLYLRLENELGGKWFFHGEARTGYARDVTKAYNNISNKYQEIIIDAAFAEVQPSLYYQVSEKFKMGFGASLFVAYGMIQIKDQSGVVSDDVTLRNIGLYPLKLEMAF